MKIERLELYGYKRLMLSNIQRFVYTPTATHQLILGTNGSGKSSVLFELSPVPAQSSNYTKEGYKDITIEHNGIVYRLISSFKNGNKHNFLKDGVEQNPGGTGQVQKELVKREFGITQELHEILIGNLKFTSMAPMERRKWITMLSSVDYSYAIGIFNKIKTVARDQQGTLKHLKQRLTQETNNLKALSELDGLEHKGHQLRDELNHLLSARTPGLQHYPTLSYHLDELLDRISQLSKNAVSLVVPKPKGTKYKTLDEVQHDVHKVESDVSTSQTLLDRFTSEFSDLEQMVSAIAGGGTVSLENIEQHILEHEQEIAFLEPQIKTFKGLIEPDYLRRDTEQVMEQLVSLLSHLPDNTDRRYTRESVQEAKDRIKFNEQIIDTGSAKLSQIAARLTLINSAKDTTCPSCNYVWRIGYSEEEVRLNEQWQDEHTAIVEKAKLEIANIVKFLEEAEHYAGLYNQFRGLTNGYPRLKPLWDYMLDNQCLTNNPQSHIGVLYTWQKDVEVSAQLDQYRRKLLHFNEVAVKQRELGGNVHFSKRLTKLLSEIETTTLSLQQLRLRAKDIRQYRDKIVKLMDTKKELEAAVEELHRFQKDLVDSLRNQSIDSVTSTHQNELAIIQRRLTEKQSVEGIVNDLTASHDEVDIDQRAMSLLAKALSPTEGLVAEQLTGFISCLIAQVNSVISNVWTYDLSVQPCGMESGELDYKFPLRIGTTDHIVPDIAMGSTAQLQIVNLAFQLTVMLYMDLTSYPLFLDEPGAGFDEQHRVNIMNFIKHLMDSNLHSQLFMVSHYVSNHGALVNAEIVVLDGSNIAVPGEYNQHVSLT